MSANAMLKTVQDQAEDGEFDDLNDILGDLDGRVEDLHWREGTDGALFVAATRRSPETIAKIQLDEAGELTAEEIDTATVRWNGLRTVSAPDSGVQDRQFD